MGRFFQSDKKQSGYSQIGDKTKTHGKYSDFPTKISKKINTLQNKIDSIVDRFKAINRTLPLSKKNIIKKLQSQISALKKSDKKQYEKKAEQQNLQTTKNNPRLKALKDKMNKEAEEKRKAKEKLLRPKTLHEKMMRKGGKLRGMGVALRGGGKVMRG
jgi:hypothetical protein